MWSKVSIPPAPNPFRSANTVSLYRCLLRRVVAITLGLCCGACGSAQDGIELAGPAQGELSQEIPAENPAEEIPACGGEHRLCLLDEDRRALAARIELIRSATETLDVLYYAVDSDEVPIALLELMRQASLRGVCVRLLVDGFKSRLPSSFEQLLVRSGMQIRIYHPPHTGRPRWLNRRLHSKLMVADRTRAIVGSRNLENEHFGYHREKRFIDCDAWLEGPETQHAASYFQWLWTSDEVLPAPTNDSLGMDVLNFRPYGRTAWKNAWRDADSDRDYQRLLSEALRRVLRRYQIQLDSPTMMSSVEPVSLRLLHDKHANKEDRHVQSVIVGMMDAAQHRLLIESPYPAFDRRLRAAIRRARARGVAVTILTNSLESTDQLNVYAAYQNQKRGLLREGVHLREYCGPGTLHAKSMIVDGRCWMIGSYNFDARSDRLNLELCLVSDDPAGAALVKTALRDRLRDSKPIEPRLWLDSGRDPAWRKRPSLWLKRTYIELIRPAL